MSTTPRFQLAARTGGTGLFGLTVAQIGIGAAAVATAAKLITAGPISPTRVAVGAAVLGAAGVVAFVPWQGRPAYEAAPAVIRFGWRRLTGRNRWFARLPLLTAAGEPGTDPELPASLAGLEVLAVSRPAWAGAQRTIAPLGLVRDRRSGTVTAVLSVKGAEFQLIEEAEQHSRLFAWGRVLASFARHNSPAARISWHEWSCPAPLSEHLAWLATNIDPAAPAAGAYQQLLNASAISVARHELRVTITIDPRRIGRARRSPGATRSAVDVALTLLRSLADRCRDAGLVVSDPLSAAEIINAVRAGADPAVVRAPSVGGSLAARTGLLPVVHAAPLAVNVAWDHVRVDGAFHRGLWVSAWPTLELGPRWLESLLLDTAGTRTITMVMEPVSPRKSRQQIRHDAVKVQGDLHNRASHDFHIPVELERARADLDRREAELAAGFAEYRYLALIDVCANSLDALDELTAAYIDVAAGCGLEVRSLDGRHDAAWACSLPIGRAPDRDLIGGLGG
ncbi:MAG: hypothetical protein NVS1B12_07890 [Acidimicrobiales bacterium]